MLVIILDADYKASYIVTNFYRKSGADLFSRFKK